MIELKSTQPGATTQRAEDLKAQGGLVELTLDQLKHVAGGGFILSESMHGKLPHANGVVLSE